MKEISMNTNVINIFKLFAVRHCCRDKRKGKKEDKGLVSSLIRVGWENLVLDQRRFHEINEFILILVKTSMNKYISNKYTLQIIFMFLHLSFYLFK